MLNVIDKILQVLDNRQELVFIWSLIFCLVRHDNINKTTLLIMFQSMQRLHIHLTHRGVPMYVYHRLRDRQQLDGSLNRIEKTQHIV